MLYIAPVGKIALYFVAGSPTKLFTPKFISLTDIGAF